MPSKVVMRNFLPDGETFHGLLVNFCEIYLKPQDVNRAVNVNENKGSSHWMHLAVTLQMIHDHTVGKFCPHKLIIFQMISWVFFIFNFSDCDFSKLNNLVKEQFKSMLR